MRTTGLETPIRSHILPRLLVWMRENGARAEADALVDDYDLSVSHEQPITQMTVPLAVHRAVYERAAETLDDPFLGLHVARDTPRGDYGIVEFAVRSSPDVGEALATFARYVPVFSEGITWGIEPGSEGVVISLTVAGEPLALGRHSNEYTWGTLVRLGRDLLQTDLIAHDVYFAHSRPSDVSELVEFFGVDRIHFGHGENRLVVDSNVLGSPVITRDKELRAVLDSHVSDLLTRRTSDVAPGPLAGLREQIRSRLEQLEIPTLDCIARKFRITPRTLQRRLRDAGTSFVVELDRARNELADVYLDDPRRTIGDVAISLGYAEQSSFERAFRRWRSMTPAQYRRQSA